VVGYFEGYGVLVDILGFYGTIYDVENVTVVGGRMFVKMKIEETGSYGIGHA